MNQAGTSPFKDRVIEVVMSIPKGKVVSYGQIAAYIGAPRAARQVGWILREVGPKVDIPWWRVINQKGKISIDGNLHADRDLQKKLLEADGVKVNDFQVDMEKFRFRPDAKVLKKMELAENYIQEVVTKFSI